MTQTESPRAATEYRGADPPMIDHIAAWANELLGVDHRTNRGQEEARQVARYGSQGEVLGEGTFGVTVEGSYLLDIVVVDEHGTRTPQQLIMERLHVGNFRPTPVLNVWRGWKIATRSGPGNATSLTEEQFAAELCRYEPVSTE